MRKFNKMFSSSYRRRGRGVWKSMDIFWLQIISYREHVGLNSYYLISIQTNYTYFLEYPSWYSLLAFNFNKSIMSCWILSFGTACTTIIIIWFRIHQSIFMIKKCVTDIMGSVDEYRVKTWAKLYGFVQKCIHYR